MCRFTERRTSPIPERPRGPTQQCEKGVEDAAKANELRRSRDITACGDFLEGPSNTARDAPCSQGNQGGT
jgi:hypothetical protein